ncbi:VWA domain-containing protein [Novipirellula artificiosorum]|uniref:von Willebrand factor type A domain protein n=1 Tax=Novipirellula artificiosorum TaxID=2528016 RepID=A0A5C6E1A3_9BACT|nr:VWA domain-containing protein [Novipirellula artificiosorum]TWU42672.1 von Willebrand factor type A domain protein [Novipirellula artificiosorum]
MILFASAWFFLLLPLPILLHFLLPPFQDARSALRVPLFDTLAKTSGQTPAAGAVVRRRGRWQFALALLCWVAIVTALARPQWLGEPIVRELPTRDLLLAIDLSGSMQTEDFVNKDGERVDRLTAVKEVLDDFLTERQGDRVAMIVFGNGAFVQIPFTQDLEVCRQLLQQTAVGMAGPKTALGDAIGLGITLFERSELKDKVMIALTDGNDTGSQVPPAEAAKIAADKGIVIHTIAVGDPAAAGEEKIDEATLKEMANVSQGRFFRANDRQELQQIYTELDKMSERKVESISHRPKRDLYFGFLAVALMLSVVYHVILILRGMLERRVSAG